jgi:histidine triad (HIT) family protein
MATLFTRIITGELPGRFVWQDEQVVAFLTTAPLRPGHTLVVPREEVDQWTDADPDLLSHLMTVAQSVGQAVKAGWDAPRAGVVIAGLEVPHLHVHVVPMWDMSDLDFASVDPDPGAPALDAAADKVRAALRDLGHGDHVPAG